MMANLGHVMTLANGIIGVGVLAMPFCFKQCGIVLATLVLLMSSVLSRLACHFLIKSAVMSRRRNFEFLAFHSFGTTGKFFVELFIIGFLLGTCIAFFVVVGDLGPQIVAKILNKRSEDIRTSVLVTTATFIVLPLGLLKNIDSLSSICTATIGFYVCLVLKIISESSRHIVLGDWYDNVIFWRPAGVLQCLPIFSMALFCQTQLFEIYEAIPNVSLEKMNQVVRGALNICTLVYLCVGFFGYVAFCTQPFTGNILTSFEPSLTSDVIKMGFVFSVAFSFPLVIFPCRASLNSLLFRRAHSHEPSNDYIPEVRFRFLTLTIVTMSLITGILIPNIEFILGIVGSTIGVMICLIFPAAFFIAISTKNTNERLLAQAILFFGMWIMVLGTYANIYAMDESANARLLITTGQPSLDNINDTPFEKILKKDFPIQEPPKVDVAENFVNLAEVRREPPIPVELPIPAEKVDSEGEKRALDGAKMLEDSLKPAKEAENRENEMEKKTKVEERAVEGLKFEEEGKSKKVKNEEQKNDILIDSEAIKKEETELEAAAGEEVDLASVRHEILRQTLEKHKFEQLKMLKEQKELLKDIKEQKEEYELEKKRSKIEVKGKRNVEETVMIAESVLEKKSAPENNDSAKSQVEKMTEDEMVEKSRGPILNALTNPKRNVSREVVDSQIASSRTNDSQAKMDKENLPIPLRMANKTMELSKASFVKNVNENTSNEENLAIRRDILEHREKREASFSLSELSANSTKNHENNDDTNESKNVKECFRDENSNNFIPRGDDKTELVKKVPTIVPPDRSTPLQNVSSVNLPILKKRDLKELKRQGDDRS